MNHRINSSPDWSSSAESAYPASTASGYSSMMSHAYPSKSSSAAASGYSHASAYSSMPAGPSYPAKGSGSSGYVSPTKTHDMSMPYSSPTGGYGSSTGGANCALPSKTACAAAVGAQYTFTAASNIPAGSYVTFVSGLSFASVQGTINGNTVVATIPSIASGQTYVFITSVAETTQVPDADILFGPAIVEVAPAPPTLDYSIV